MWKCGLSRRNSRLQIFEKIYCNDYCRNHHCHKRCSEENLEFILYKKGLTENYKFVKLYQDKKKFREDLIKF